MSSGEEERALRIAHVAFLDIVGYSLLATDQQVRAIQTLQTMVRALPGFTDAPGADQRICIPTGDGMAIVCFGEPTEPVRYARDLAIKLRQDPVFGLRIGLNTGPVYRSEDINANRNVAGGGINIAQRIMDCGDAGHILLSQPTAETLLQLTAWRDAVHDLGECEVKHGVRLRVFSLWTSEFGNPALPRKILLKGSTPAAKARRKWKGGLLTAAAVIAILAALPFWQRNRRDQQIVELAQKMRTEYKSAEADPAESADRLGAIQRNATAILKLDRNNGHGLYYSGEIKRIQFALKNGIQMPRLNEYPCVIPPEAEREFYDYIEKASRSQTQGDGDDVDQCYQRANGFCAQRTEWVDHLLANLLYQQALAAEDREAKIDLLRRARDKARIANHYRDPEDPNAPTGFKQCRPTQALIADVDKLLREPAPN